MAIEHALVCDVCGRRVEIHKMEPAYAIKVLNWVERTDAFPLVCSDHPTAVVEPAGPPMSAWSPEPWELT